MTRFMTTTEKMVALAIIIAAALFTLHAFTGFTPNALAGNGGGNGGKPKGGDNPCQPSYHQEGGKCVHNGDGGGNCGQNQSGKGGKGGNGGDKGYGNKDGCGDETTTETTPTETTPTTPEPPSTTPTTPSTTPEPPSTTPEPPSTTPEPDKPGVDKPGTTDKPQVDKPTLEDDLDQQAQANGATNAPGHVQSADELPYTGITLWPFVLLGVFLVAAGLILRAGKRSS